MQAIAMTDRTSDLGRVDPDEKRLAAVLVGLLEDADKVIEIDLHAARALIGRATELLQIGIEGEVKPAHDLGGGVRNVAGLAPWQMRRVVIFIEQRLPQHISSTEVAAVTRLSPGYFSRAFKGSFGMTPCNYILRKRVERAQAMMLESDASLCQIALDCGFCDQAHFSRLFRRYVGISPNIWRRSRHDPAPGGLA